MADAAQTLIIEDEAMSPYYIKLNKYTYDVYQKYPQKIDKAGKVINAYEKIAGSAPSVGEALKVILNLKLRSLKKKVTLKEYVAEIRKINSELNKLSIDDTETRLKKAEDKIEKMQKEIDKLSLSNDNESFEVTF